MFAYRCHEETASLNHQPRTRDLKFEDIIPEVAGIYPKVMQDGDVEAGAWSCGMVAGLIHDVPSVQELIDRIMSEAEEIINKRLAGFQAA
jgi:nitronate monooxygenase